MTPVPEVLRTPPFGFSPATFQRRRAAALERLGSGALLLPAAPLRFRSRDTHYPYRPDSELFYLTGCTEPGAVALLRPEQEAFVLFFPRRDEKEELWSGPRPSLEEAATLYGADAVYGQDELESRLPPLLEGARRLFYRIGALDRLDGIVRELLAKARLRGAREGRFPRELVDPGEILDPLRIRKDAEEIEVLRAAARCTAEGFQAVVPRIADGMGEWEVQSLLEAHFRRAGALGPAYPTIAASGPGACTLHYSALSRRMRRGELLLLDGGAEVGLYAGDLTRTVPVGGRFSALQRAVYEVVLAAQSAALSAVVPGVGVDRIHLAAVSALTEGLLDLGVLEGEREALLEAKAHLPFFPHQTSHWLGLDVHDVGDYAREGTPVALAPGMVLTVEPGLYFPERSEKVPEPFRGLGVRIEDDILVTETGVELLSGGLPRSPDAVEAWITG